MQLTLTLPDELAANFQSEDGLRRTLYEDFIIEQRQVGAISLSKAAEHAGLWAHEQQPIREKNTSATAV